MLGISGEEKNMEGQKKKRTLGEKRAFAEGYMLCWSNILQDIKDKTTRENRFIEMMVEDLEEEINESKNIS